MSDNDDFLIVEGQSPDWIELFNPTDSAVLLSNFYLSDNAEELQKWQLPTKILPAKAFQLFYASGQNSSLNCNFKIDKKGEAIYLSTSAAMIDSFPPVAIEENSSYGRFPDGDNSFIFFTSPSPGINNIQKDQDQLALFFSTNSGFYNNDILLELTSSDSLSQIFYSRDGSTPNMQSELYTEPIFLNQNNSPVNNSTIPTSDRWTIPKQTPFKANVIRAIVYRNGRAMSKVYTHTYFIHPKMETKYTFPIVSIIVDSSYLFCDTNGIYVAGLDRNYSQKGREWERPSFFQFFDISGSCQLQQNIGIRTYGNKGRVMPQKSLLLYARSEYGKKRLNHSFFGDKENDQFKRLILRSASSNDWKNTLFKNELAQELARNLNLEHPASIPVITFVNGEYWGIHHLSERMDEYYIEDRFQLEKDSIDYLSSNAIVEMGSSADFLSLYDYIHTHSLAENQYFEYVARQLDINNLIDYYAVELFLANTDWPYNNIKFWKAQNDGKWRWLFFDCDECMSYEYYNALGNFINTSQYHQDFPEWSTFLLHHLFKNENFNTHFRMRFEELLNNDFSSFRFFTLVDSLSALYKPEVAEHAIRWSGPNDLIDWQESVKGLYSFGSIRPTQMKQLLQEYFGSPFLIYPNPAKDKIHIKTTINSIESGQISIYSSNGFLIETRECCNTTICLKNLTAGVYFLRLRLNDFYYHEKVVVW